MDREGWKRKCIAAQTQSDLDKTQLWRSPHGRWYHCKPVDTLDWQLVPVSSHWTQILRLLACWTHTQHPKSTPLQNTRSQYYHLCFILFLWLDLALTLLSWQNLALFMFLRQKLGLIMLSWYYFALNFMFSCHVLALACLLNQPSSLFLQPLCLLQHSWNRAVSYPWSDFWILSGTHRQKTE